MTISAVQEFLEKVGQDEALQAELTQAIEGGNERQAVTSLAESKGYQFSPEELMAEIQKRQAAAAETAGELSDEDLEEVAGGITPIPAALIIASAGGAGGAIGAGSNRW